MDKGFTGRLFMGWTGLNTPSKGWHEPTRSLAFGLFNFIDHGGDVVGGVVSGFMAGRAHRHNPKDGI